MTTENMPPDNTPQLSEKERASYDLQAFKADLRIKNLTYITLTRGFSQTEADRLKEIFNS